MPLIKVIIDEYEAGQACKFYTCYLNGNTDSEFDQFLDRSEEHNDLDKLISILNDRILEENGALERYFKPEGRMSDRVWALPLISKTLRLYCIRISERILILGNGGTKTTETYQEDEHLNNCVEILQKVDAELRKLERNEKIYFLGKTIIDCPIEITITH